MSQIAFINIRKESDLDGLIALGGVQIRDVRRLFLFKTKLYRVPLLDSLRVDEITCTACSGSVFIRLSEDYSEFNSVRYRAQADALSKNSACWIEIYGKEELHNLIQIITNIDHMKYGTDNLDLFIGGTEWLAETESKLNGDDLVIFRI